jgi:hypothetical protein
MLKAESKYSRFAELKAESKYSRFAELFFYPLNPLNRFIQSLFAFSCILL